MADDQALDGGTGTNPYTAAADDIGGVKYQRIKLRAADDGSAGADASAANPFPVVDSAQNVLIGAVTETAPATDTASSGLNGRAQRVAQRLTSLIALLPGSLGQKTSAASLAVVVASDQSAVPVSGTITANAGSGPFPVSDNAGSLTVDAPVATPVAARLSDGAAFLTTSGSRLSVDASGVAVPITDNAGSLTVDAPVGTPVFTRLSSGSVALDPVRVDNGAFTDNASHITPSGYLFDEVAGTALTENDAAAARIDSKRAQVIAIEDATTRGQRAAVDANGAQQTTQAAATATLANVAGSASSVTLQAANTLRKGLVIVNDSTAILYVKFGSAASATSFTYFLAGSVSGVPATLELPAVVYTGIVTGIWASAVGAARVTELT